MDLFKLLISIFLCQRGEEEGDEGGDAGSGGNPLKEGQDDTPGEGEGDGAGDGSEDDGSAGDGTPKYGEFGNEPSVDDVYNALQEATQKAEGLKSKTTQTEKNAAAINQAIAKMGFKALTDADGNVTLVPAKEQSKRETRFKDDHKSLFDEKVLEAITYLIQDNLDGFKEELHQNTSAQTSFQKAQIASNDRMLKLFPQLEGNSETFNQDFYDKATEIWKGDPDLRRNPKGELMAASMAAAEMGISPVTIAKAKKEGFKQGAAGKKILGPAGGSQSRSGKSGFSRLSKEDYFKLEPEEREKYDQQALDAKKSR